MHCQWRDCKAWQDIGLPLSTSSNEACKMYDATLTQYVGWYDDTSVNGIEGAVDCMLKADPNFVMGHVVSNGLDVMGTGRTTRLDPEFKASIDSMVNMATKNGLSEREKSHVTAVKLYADGYMSKACDIWEDILVQHPTDLLALKFAHDAYFYLGYQPQMRDSIARVFPHWNPSMPLYGYLMGMHSFGLEETNLYAQAEKVGRKALEVNKRDAWATHALAHVLEMEGRQKEGISFMSTTVADWSSCGMLACHNFWHWAVYHVEKGEHQGALDIFDSEIGRKVNSGALLDIVDATSILYRLQLEGIDVGDRWEGVYEICRPHIDDHILSFNDQHILMGCLGAKKTDTAQKMMKSLEELLQTGTVDQVSIMRDVGTPILQALLAYEDSQFDKVVELLEPVRYKIVTIGGSNAQRDVFNLLLIHAALKSPNSKHHKLARQLLIERKALKENAPMTDRLMARAMAQHAN